MCLISVPNLKEIHPEESWLKVVVNQCEEEKYKEIGQFSERHIRKLHSQFPSDLVCHIMCMESIKCVNLIEISPVVIEI